MPVWNSKARTEKLQSPLSFHLVFDQLKNIRSPDLRVHKGRYGCSKSDRWSCGLFLFWETDTEYLQICSRNSLHQRPNQTKQNMEETGKSLKAFNALTAFNTVLTAGCFSNCLISNCLWFCSDRRMLGNWISYTSSHPHQTVFPGSSLGIEQLFTISE